MPEPEHCEKAGLTGEYWAAVQRHQLVRPVCRSCSKSHFPPQGVCPWCQSADWSYEASSGRGRVYSHTTIHRPPHPGFAAPYVVADIDMDEGWRLFSWITNCEPAAVDIGMPVTVAFTRGHVGESLPVFEPAETET
ncbi:MAG: OB-fold domain-containing protein [Acidimicrobiaceae bacterium]|jgi:uncharacterized OB-fold protein